MQPIQELINYHHNNDTGFSRHYMLLYSIALGMESKNVFEFGSGYSSKAILHALEQTKGKLTSCDCRSFSESCGKYFQNEEETKRLQKRWRYINKRSSNIKTDISKEIFDVVLHDGSHTWQEVAEDLKMISPKMKKGSILMLHDTNHPTNDYKLCKSIDYIPCDFEKITLPYGYGLTIIRILGNEKNGEIKIKWRKSLKF